MEQVTFRLPPDLAAHLHTLADQRDVTPGQVLREMIAKDRKRTDQAKTPNRADEPLVARLQRLLASDMADAVSWGDLQNRLRALGHQIQPAGGGLTIHDATGTRLCKSSELGFPYARLVRKFRAPMPGHPHQMNHILNEFAARVSTDGEDNLVLIEDD